MAIEQLGKTLLADVRQRNDALAKKAAKAQKKDEMLSLGVGIAGKIGNAILESNFKDFLQNEKVLQEKAQYKTAVGNVESVSNEYNAIQKSGLSTQQYFAQQLRPLFEQRAKENLSWDVVGDAGAYNAYVTSEVDKLAKKQAEAFEQAYSLAGGVASAEDYATMLELNAKRAKSTNIGDAAVKTIGRWFSGKSRDDVEQEALDAIVNSKMGGRIDAFNAFVERYNETKNLVTAYDFANLTVPEVPEDQQFKTDVKAETKVVGDSLLQIKTTTFTDRNTGETRQKISEDKVMFTDDDKINSTALSQLRTSFDFMKDGRGILEPAAFSKFIKQAQDQGLDPANIQSISQYNQISSMFGQFTKDPNNLEDTAKDALRLEGFRLLTNAATELDIMLGELTTKNPNDRASYFQQNIMPTLEIYKNLANELVQGLPQD